MNVHSASPAFVLFATLVVLGSTAAHADRSAYRRLRSGEIREEIIAHEVSDEMHWRDHFFPNGSIAGYVWDDPNPGTWSISGDELCVSRWSDEQRDCFEVWLDGKDVEYRREGAVMAVGRVRPLGERARKP